MKILILDDDQGRHDAFAAGLAGHKVQHVYTAAEAIEVLKTSPPFDAVFLDHDLTDFHYRSFTAGRRTGLGEDTGYAVAAFIARELDEQARPGTVVVHSWNPPGAANMMVVLQDANISALRWTFNSTLHGLDIKD